MRGSCCDWIIHESIPGQGSSTEHISIRNGVLQAQKPRNHDLFSADLSDDQLLKTFDMIQKQGLLRHKLMVLYSGADQTVPDTVDKEKSLTRWNHATNHGELFQRWDQEHTSILPNVSRALTNDDQAEPRRFLVEKVLGYLQASLTT